jgi:sugar lactone lactonase YvrE
VIFSDVKRDTLYRYIWETGAISAFRKPSFGTNGNSFDYQGRQLSNQDSFRRVIRWEPDGTMTVLADNYKASPSTLRTTWPPTRMAASGSPIRPSAAPLPRAIPTLATAR